MVDRIVVCINSYTGEDGSEEHGRTCVFTEMLNSGISSGNGARIPQDLTCYLNIVGYVSIMN